jgi:hypothetical protein
MDNELAKKRIASYLHGNITEEELDAFIDSFGDALAEETYTEFLIEKFEEFVAAEPLNEPAQENIETSESALPAEEKKQKPMRPGRFMYVCDIPFCMRVAASFMIAALYSLECYCLKPHSSSPDHLLTLTD